MMFEKQGTSTTWMLVSFGLLVFFFSVGNLRLTAQNDRPPVVDIQEVNVDDSGETVQLNLNLSSRIGGNARADVHLRSAVTGNHLYRQSLSISSDPGTISVGRFNDLWASTYRLELNVPPSRQRGDARFDVNTYRPSVSVEFQYGTNVPSPSEQEEQIYSQFRELFRSSADQFLHFLVQARNLRQRRRAGGNVNQITQERDDLVADFRSEWEQLQARVRQNAQGHTFGSPLEEGYEELTTFVDRANQYVNVMEQAIVENWQPTDEASDMSVRRRLQEGLASPREHRSWAVRKFHETANHLRTGFIQPEFQQASQLARETLTSVATTFVDISTSGNEEDRENPSERWNQAIQNAVEQTGDPFQTVDRYLWLYRDLDNLLEEEEQTFSQGRRVRAALSRIRGLENQDVEFGTNSEALETQETLVKGITNALFQFQRGIIVDGVNQWRWYHDAVGSLHSRFRQLSQLNQRGNLQAGEAANQISQFLDQLIPTIQDERDRASDIREELSFVTGQTMLDLRSYISRHFSGTDWGETYVVLIDDMRDVAQEVHNGIQSIDDVWTSLEPLLDRESLQQDPLSQVERIVNAYNENQMNNVQSNITEHEEFVQELENRIDGLNYD